jgi:hypothetical protein
MINLNAIIQSAQGGAAVDNLASRFGISPAQAQSAIEALLPAFQMGLQNKVQSNDGLGSILSHLGNGIHQEAYNNAGAAQSGTAAAQGTSVLGDLFGGPHTSTQVAQQASAESGVSAAVIQAMLPVIASMIMGGLTHSAQSGGLGGILSQAIGAAMGGQGGGLRTPGDVAPAPQDGGIGGMIGSVLGSLLGGGSAQQAPTGAPYAGGPQPGAYDEPAPSAGPAGSSQAVLGELSRMFQAGTPASPQHEASLANILGR